MYRIGIDIGGTFTDLVAVDAAGAVTIAKYPSTPADPSIGLVEGLSTLAEEIGLSREELLKKTALILHGTTVATNALLEGKGAKVGMLTTDGFRDVIEQREGLKPDRYNVRLPAEPVMVPRSLRLPVTERIRYDGTTEIELDEQSIFDAIEVFKKEGVESIAVCCMHSYADDSNERRIGEIFASQMPDAYVCLSSRVLPQIKEFERFSTTAVNAFVGPILSNYMNRLRGRLNGAGYDKDVLIMHSHGGLATIDDSIKLGAGLVLSGPAGGIAGARHAANITGVRDLITFDMGGTSSDIALLDDGEAHYSSDRSVSGTRVALPSIDIHTIGAGGGSIANVEIGGMLRVGPESAGSDPGPACYSRGGTRATTTDANVVLGYYDADNFLGGRIKFDGEAAKKAVGSIGNELGVDTVEAAEGVLRVINTQMAEGIRIVSVRAGTDPRNYTLLSFGGAAGLHITDIARILDIKRVIIPKPAAVLSAWGMLATDLRYDFVRTAVKDIHTIAPDELRSLFDDMEKEGRERVADAGDLAQGVEVIRSLDMRYGEQIFEIPVSLSSIDVDSDDLIERITGAFHKRHEELYTYSSPEREVVLVNARVSVVGVMTAISAEPVVATQGRIEPKGERRAYVGDWIDLPVYDLDQLGAGHRISGPAIVESRTTTILLKQGDSTSVTDTGWLDIN
ncbi:MAG: hydantoinase/oxoprolinase family protein, partial [Gammaproteobacteria bacterium]|nr:hydantoinase/oxoprolinase family protein [Gammaproteobacteria bacterium]